MQNVVTHPKGRGLANLLVAVVGGFLIWASCLSAVEVLVESEGFDDRGGWLVDPQFLDIMGSPYLLAHGLGKPVANARTKVTFPETGTYYIWVRTKDWVAEPEWAPGKFQLAVDGKLQSAMFGTTGNGKWVWQKGGSVEIAKTTVMIELRDLTGFDGRCDAILFTRNINQIILFC